MARPRILIVSFASHRLNDGALRRVSSLEAMLKSRADVSIMTIDRPHANVYDLYIDSVFVCRRKERHWFVRFLKFPSFNQARMPSLPNLQTLCSIRVDALFCHTGRMYWALSSKDRNDVCGIDLCDNLQTTYKVAFINALRKARIKLAVVFFWEWVVERVMKYMLPKGIFYSYISQNDAANGCPESTVLPNLLLNFDRMPAIPPGKFQSRGSDSIRFGVIGNFRTVANRSAVENILRSKWYRPDCDKIVLCGFGAKECSLELGFAATIFDNYSSLDEIAGVFDVGCCIVDVQGGVQNKILDYILLGVPILASKSAIAPFQKDPHLSIALDERFVVAVQKLTREEIIDACSKDFSENSPHLVSVRNRIEQEIAKASRDFFEGDCFKRICAQ